MGIQRQRSPFLSLAITLLALLCGVGTARAQSPISISITPANATVPAKGFGQLRVIVTLSDGSTRDVTSFATWSSSAPKIATVSNQVGSQGLVTGLVPGTTVIRASYDNSLLATTDVTVTSAALVSFSIQPAAASTGVGLNVQFRATGVFNDGSRSDVTSLASWSSSNTRVVTISNSGQTKALASARAAGSANVTAAIPGLPPASVPMTVFASKLVSLSVAPQTPFTPVGTHLQFSATGTFSNGSVADVSSSVNWDSANDAVATIDKASGLAVAQSAGTVRINAVIGQVTGSSTLTVHPFLRLLQVTPSTATMPLATSQQLQVTGLYLDGTTRDLTETVAWISSNPATAAVSNAAGTRGRVTAVALGSATVTASYAGAVSAPVPVTVTAPALVSLAVSPSTSSVALGTTRQFTAIGTYTDGSTLNVTNAVSWTSDNSSVATIGATGLASTLATGSAGISASLSGISGSATLTVTPATLVSIAVTPASASIALGLQQQFGAVGTFTDGSNQDLTATVLWESSAPGIASINAQGLATSVATGATTIKAALGAITGSSGLTITPASLVSLAIAPADSSMALGTSRALSVTGTFTDGSTQNLTQSVTWASSDVSVATISNANGTRGLAASVALGVVTITATSGAVIGSTQLTVTAAELLTIAVTPAIPQIPLGTSRQFNATGTYTDGSTQDLTATAHWSSSDAAVATISNSPGTEGAASSVAQGVTTIAAALGGVSGQTTLTVTEAVLSTIEITPSTPSIALGTTQQFTANGNFTDGSTRDLTTTVTWSSSMPGTATIGATGLAASIAVGSTTITAAQGSVAGQTTLTVTPATLVLIEITPTNPSIPLGTTQQFQATGLYTDGTTQDITTGVHWTSSAADVATISIAAGSQGLATSTGTGTTTIGASLGTVSATTTLTVTPAALVSIALSPQNPSIPLGTNQQFTATGSYTDGSTKDITTTVTWTSSLATVAVVSNASSTSGLATSSGVGVTTITASVGAVSASTNLTVGEAQLVSISVAPATSSVALGLSQQFTATGTFTDGTTKNVTATVSWTSSAPAVATVSASGFAQSVTQGSTTITATSGAISGDAVLTVTGAVLASIAVTPANASVVAGLTVQFTATGTYTDGSTQNLSASVTWASSSGAATIGSTGLARGVASGTTTISATAGSISGSTTLTVTPALLVTLVVTPTSATIPQGSTQRFTATGTFTDGSSQNLSNTVAWTSSVPTVATVNGTGLANGVGLGVTTITATLGAFAPTASLTVEVPVVPGGQPRFVYVANINNNTVSGYLIDQATGGLNGVPGGSFSTGSSPRAVAVDPSGRFVYVANGGSNSVSAYSINGTTGSLTAVTGAPFAAGSVPFALAVDPTGNFLYVVNNGSSTVSAYTIDVISGALTPVAGPAVSTGSSPAAVVLDPTGKFVYVANSSSNNISAYAVNAATGALSPLGVGPTAASVSGPQWIVIEPQGKYLYLVGTSSNRVQGFTINPDTGALTSIGTVLTGTSPLGAAADPSGRFLYVANQASNTVSSFAINPDTGVLVAIGAPIAAGTTPRSVAVDPSGRFLYVANQSSNNVSSFGINGSTGALTAGSGSPFVAGAAPFSVGSSGTAAPLSATLEFLEIVPASANFLSVAVGQTLQLTLVGTYSDGSKHFLTASANWSSNASTVAVGNSGATKGRITTNGFGSAVITATIGTLFATANVTSTQAMLVSLAVTPAAPTIATGTAMQFTATGTYSDGTVAKLTTGVTWTSSNAGAATISTSGLATSVAAGTTAIGAAVGAVSGTAPLTVVAASPDQPRFLFVANRSAGTAGAYVVDQANGTLAEATGSPVSTSSNVRAIATEPSGRFVFAGWEFSSSVRVFRVNAVTGALTVVGDFPTGGSSVYALTVNATGRLLFAANRDTHSVSVLSIDEETGGLSPVPGSPFAVGTSTCPTSMAIDTSGQFLYVGGDCKAELWAFAIDPATGGLTAIPGAPVATSGSFLQGIVISPGSARLYATANSNRILGYAIGVSGGLTPIAGSPFFPGGSCLWGLAAEPSGRFLYATDLCAGNIYGYAINAATGALSNMTGSPFSGAGNARAAVIDPSGRFLYASDISNNRIAAYGINATTGTLTAAAGSPFAAGSGPWGLAISATPIVSSATLVSLAIVPADPTVVATTITGTTQFLAIGTYSDGSKRYLTTSATWTSSVSSVANIGNTLTSKGRATVTGFGQTTITASFGGHLATSTFTVAQPTVVSIAVTPASPTIALGTAVQFTTTVTYSNGTTSVNPSGVTWTSSDVGVATISPTGVATSVSVGTTTITATWGGFTGNATLKVQ